VLQVLEQALRTISWARLVKLARLPTLDADPAVLAFRREVKEWLAQNWGAAKQEANHRLPYKKRGWDPEFSRMLGRKGWIGLGWPKEVGGGGRGAAEQLAFLEEMKYAQAPMYFHASAEWLVAPPLITHGTLEQKAEMLPAIQRGELSIAIHYSEPEAGSDLAALRTEARRDGTDWVINGQKLWTTDGDTSDCAWLAARTNPDAQPRHAGISVFIVPLNTSGVTIRPSMAMYGKTFSTTFYDSVRVPSSALVGKVNDGWRIITDALAAERMAISSMVVEIERIFDRLTDYLGRSPRHRNNMAVRDRIGNLAAEIAVARLFVRRNTQLVEMGRALPYEAAMAKLFASELQERLAEAALDIMGTGATLSEDAPDAPLGELEQFLRHTLVNVLGGGTSEMQRNAIALRGLGLPRGK
jgi:alkylation response protein AidB-like acyl-CoA dehydrogenase